MGPVEGGGVAVRHPHKTLAAQDSLDRAVACSWSLTLQGAVGGNWQPAQHHLSQSTQKDSQKYGEFASSPGQPKRFGKSSRCDSKWVLLLRSHIPPQCRFARLAAAASTTYAAVVHIGVHAV